MVLQEVKPHSLFDIELDIFLRVDQFFAAHTSSCHASYPIQIIRVFYVEVELIYSLHKITHDYYAFNRFFIDFYDLNVAQIFCIN